MLMAAERSKLCGRLLQPSGSLRQLARGIRPFVYDGADENGRVSGVTVVEGAQMRRYAASIPSVVRGRRAGFHRAPMRQALRHGHNLARLRTQSVNRALNNSL